MEAPDGAGALGWPSPSFPFLAGAMGTIMPGLQAICIETAEWDAPQDQETYNHPFPPLPCAFRTTLLIG